MSKVKVLAIEGFASRMALGSCACVSNRTSEALTEVCIGRVLSRERILPGVPTRSHTVEGNTCTASPRDRRVRDSARSQTPCMYRRVILGNRESLRLPAARDGTAGRIGKSENARR
jgi:hypothetical protein